MRVSQPGESLLPKIDQKNANQRRLPSFNDFSPEILKGDLRICLELVANAGGDDKQLVAQFANAFFKGVLNGRSSTNIPASLRSTGLSTGTRPLQLSSFGEKVLAAATPEQAAQIFCSELIRCRNGDVLLRSIQSLRRRGEKVSKEALKRELINEGIDGLSNNTTDHTTFKNWLIVAGILDAQLEVDDSLLKTLTGVSFSEESELSQLKPAQQIFLQRLRRLHLTEAGPFQATDLLKTVIDEYPDLFDPAQFAKQVREPLVDGGWMSTTGLAGGAHGGKSGWLLGTPKLLAIPDDKIVPEFESRIPSELRSKINVSLGEIREDLWGADKHRCGIALELLALRMIMDIGLQPRHFRLRSAQSAFAEVDLVAEGSGLLFSRWTVQCKRYDVGSNTKIGLGDTAKEVGIALFVNAHVVMMVTTTSFTAEATRYAESIMRSTPLQFVFIDGKAVKEYLAKGRPALLATVRRQAQGVLRLKQQQSVGE